MTIDAHIDGSASRSNTIDPRVHLLHLGRRIQSLHPGRKPGKDYRRAEAQYWASFVESRFHLSGG